MSASITVRNLTAQPLTIKLVERYEAPKRQDVTSGSYFNASSWISNFIGLTSNSSEAPTNAELGEKALSFSKQQVDIRLEPCTTHKTDIDTTERKPGDVVRLTFHGDGPGRWRIDLPAVSPTSRELISLIPNPTHDYTAIYLSESSFLAISESTDLSSWQRAFNDETPLSALSIPGTHNSPTHYKALPSVRCQAVGLVEQLRNGVRFFDIRVQPVNPGDPKDDALNLVHGAFPISFTGAKRFRHLINDVHDFLRENTSETVIMSLKREGVGNATDQQLSQILHDHYVAGDEAARWYTEPRIPNLGEVRGKIVLMRRFALADGLKHEWQDRGWGLDAENWAYNSPDFTYANMRVQDFCEVLKPEGIETKIGFCCEHFERAAQVIAPVPGVTTDSINPVPAGPLFLNFLSASNFWKVECWPGRIAAKMNPVVTAFLCQKHRVGDLGVDGPKLEFGGDGGVGIVVCDWVGKNGDWDLVRTIVAMNSRCLLRQQRHQ